MRNNGESIYSGCNKIVDCFYLIIFIGNGCTFDDYFAIITVQFIFGTLKTFFDIIKKWIIGSDKAEAIEQYMGIHQGDEEATELWIHFQKVVNWVDTIFPTYRKEMKGLDCGQFYKKYGERKYNPVKLDQEVAELMADKEIQKHSGIYEFLLSDRTLFEKLNLRTFDIDDMRVAYERQKGHCPYCKDKNRVFKFEEMRGDHIKPWSKGGKTKPENLQMLCADCNARKSDKF